MASILTAKENFTDCLSNSNLLYVHCVSKDDFNIRLPNLLCVELVCREIHLSFIDNLAERRVALIPKSNSRIDAESTFRNLDSPSLISVSSSCDIKFLDMLDHREELFDGILFWDFDILPSLPCAYVKPKNLQPTDSVLDRKLPLLNLEAHTTCNCFTEGRKCLVSLDTHREECPVQLQDLTSETSHFEENDFDEEEYDEEEMRDGEQKQGEEEEEEEEEEEFHVECFKIVGSHWEPRYQDALQKCYELKVSDSAVKIRAKPEPDNIKDCNAIKFEVLSNGQWLIMGYCGVKKIPKLKRAMHNNLVVSLKIFNMKRKWIPQIREFRYISGVNIVKRGPWEKDDLQNVYNSVIGL